MRSSSTAADAWSRSLPPTALGYTSPNGRTVDGKSQAVTRPSCGASSARPMTNYFPIACPLTTTGTVTHDWSNSSMPRTRSVNRWCTPFGIRRSFFAPWTVSSGRRSLSTRCRAICPVFRRACRLPCCHLPGNRSPARWQKLHRSRRGRPSMSERRIAPGGTTNWRRAPHGRLTTRFTSPMPWASRHTSWPMPVDRSWGRSSCRKHRPAEEVGCRLDCRPGWPPPKQSCGRSADARTTAATPSTERADISQASQEFATPICQEFSSTKLTSADGGDIRWRCWATLGLSTSCRRL